MNIQVEDETIKLVERVERDLPKAVAEALNLWLETRLLKCPLTHKFCENINESCNNCHVANS